MKTFNVDEFLNERAVEIDLGGKKFKVKDVPEEATELFGKEGVKPKEIVKVLLGCNDADLKGYGTAAFNAIINEVTENLFHTSSQKNQSQD